jgi:RNA polymerase sigma-70 factor (ECF subfamily)
MSSLAFRRASDPGETTRMEGGVDVDGWYRRYGESVYRRCLRLTGDPARALDLVQEVFLRVHRFKDSYRGEARPLGWLYAIAHRCFVDSLRKEPPVDVEQLRAIVTQEEAGLQVAVERHDAVATVLSRLPEDVREIVILRYFDELEHEAIAARLGVNEKTVRRKLQRFLKSARKLLAWGAV